jgi:hypothetical protein
VYGVAKARHLPFRDSRVVTGMVTDCPGIGEWREVALARSADMDAGTVLALYGAALSTALAGARAATWFSARRPRVSVAILLDWEEMDGGGGFPLVVVEAVNRGSRAVEVTSMGWETQDGRSGRESIDTPLSRKRLPRTIEPWQGHREAEIQGGSGIDLHRPVVGWVKLVTGEVFRSRPTTLQPRRPGI